MKKPSHWAYIGLITFLMSCSKDNSIPTELASFTIINALNNGVSVKADFTGAENTFATTQVETNYNTSRRFAVPSGLTRVKIVSSLNFDDVLYSTALQFNSGDIYSLILAGGPGAVDTILIKEDLPIQTDTTVKMRFINGSNSGPVKIVPIMVDYNGTRIPQAAIASLNYREKTEFITYPASGSALNYRIELHDPLTDNLLFTTFVPTNDNVTVIVTGNAGEMPELGAIRLFHGR